MKQRPKYVLHPVLALVAGCAWACGAIDANSCICMTKSNN